MDSSQAPAPAINDDLRSIDPSGDLNAFKEQSYLMWQKQHRLVNIVGQTYQFPFDLSHLQVFSVIQECIRNKRTTLNALATRITDPAKFQSEYTASGTRLNHCIYALVRLLETFNRIHYPYLDPVMGVYLSQNESDAVMDLRVYKIRFLLLSMMSQHVVWFEINAKLQNRLYEEQSGLILAGKPLDLEIPLVIDTSKAKSLIPRPLSAYLQAIVPYTLQQSYKYTPTIFGSTLFSYVQRVGNAYTTADVMQFNAESPAVQFDKILMKGNRVITRHGGHTTNCYLHELRICRMFNTNNTAELAAV